MKARSHICGKTHDDEAARPKRRPLRESGERNQLIEKSGASGDENHRRSWAPLLGWHRQKQTCTVMRMVLDKATLDVRDLPDEDLIALLCATEDEIEAHGEFNELKELLLDCAMELLKRPSALLSVGTPPGRKAREPMM